MNIWLIKKLDESTLMLKLRIVWNEQFLSIRFEEEQSNVLSLEKIFVNTVSSIVIYSAGFSKEKMKPV